MVAPLLKTKLYVPPRRARLVSRPRLIERLNEGANHRLVLISASAGCGKTTLLSEWASETTRPVAWLSLDERDNAPLRFWAHFVAALQTIQAKLGDVALANLQSTPAPPTEPALEGLLDEVASLPYHATLVLDDFHLITMPQIHDGITFLLDNLPPRIHLVIASRPDPPWANARRPAWGEMTILRTGDLRFTTAEAHEFLNQVMHLDLSPRDVDALEERTEGWIAGLQMAALSLRGHQDANGFIETFAGSHRFVLDYLQEEVLGRQPEHIQQFLLQTSVLDFLSGPLCDAVLASGPQSPSSNFQPPTSNSQSILEYLESSNLFLVRLDKEGLWYRYHHLFKDLLQKRLEQTWPDKVPLVNRRASRWYEKNELTAEAVRYALAAHDIDRAAQLVKRNVLALMDHGELTALLDWLRVLPKSVLHQHPWLCVAYAWALTYSSQLDAVEPLLQDIETVLTSLGTDPATTRGASRAGTEHALAHIAAIRAYMARMRGEYSYSADFANKALDLLPEKDRTTRALMTSLVVFAERPSSGLAAATRATAKAVDLSREADDTHVTVMTLCDLAGILGLQGRLHEAATTYRDAIHLGQEYAGRTGRQLPITGYVYGRLSCVLRQWNELQEAVRLARKGVELCRRWGWTELYADCCAYLALALQAIGDEEGALHTIGEAQRVSGQVSDFYAALADILEIKIRLAQGDLASVSRWAAAQEGRFHRECKFDLGTVPAYLTWLRVLIAQASAEIGPDRDRVSPVWESRLTAALEPMERLLEGAKDRDRNERVITSMTIRALALQAMGRLEEAHSALEQALRIGEPGGYIQRFVIHGEPMARLLQATASSASEEYVARLLAAFKLQTSKQTPAPLPPLGEKPALLSRRESEVLRLVATGMTNRQISAELDITVGTVKGHTNRIYGKLDVRSRTRAVARARELGLL